MYVELSEELWINEACPRIIGKWEDNIKTDPSVKER